MHAQYVLQSSVVHKSFIKILEDIKRDGPQKTFDLDAWTKLNRAAFARLGFLDMMIKGGPLCQEVTRLSTTATKSPEDVLLLNAIEFLTNEKFKKERGEVPAALFQALVQQNIGT